MRPFRGGGAWRAALPLVAVAYAPPPAPPHPPAATVAVRAPAVVSRLKVTVLSTMLAGDPGRGIGEWGFAALIEADGDRLLVDTGARPETVLRNARELGIDLAGVEHVILTHGHGDHVGGLVTLRTALRARDPRALAVAHVAPPIFWSRPGTDGSEQNALLRERGAYEAAGGRFVAHAAATELRPGVWFTGPVPRPNAERNWSGLRVVRSPDGDVEDQVQEDASIVVNTREGLVVITGCGHAGVVNILTKAQDMLGGRPVHAVLGGLHLFTATDSALAWTGRELRARGVADLLGVHCTGIEATHRLRGLLGLPRAAVATGAVGSSFTLGEGIDPLALGR